jgi:hypothetical protein
MWIRLCPVVNPAVAYCASNRSVAVEDAFSGIPLNPLWPAYVVEQWRQGRRLHCASRLVRLHNLESLNVNEPRRLVQGRRDHVRLVRRHLHVLDSLLVHRRLLQHLAGLRSAADQKGRAPTSVFAS